MNTLSFNTSIGWITLSEDNNLITSNGPSTAVDVAFVLLEALTSKENTLKVRNLMGF